MGSVSGAVELQESFANILTNIINVVNMSISAVEQLHSVMNAPIDTASIQEAQNRLNQAAQGDLNPAPPVEVPVVWKTNTLEVFTGTGIERFRQEAASANAMLAALNQTQAQIAARAAQTNIFPANMAADMNGMQNRIQAIQNRMQEIAGNHLNMGSDRENAELEQLREKLNQAVQMQERMNQAVEDMNVQDANEAYRQLSQIIGDTERHIRDNVDEQERFNNAVEEAQQNLKEIWENTTEVFQKLFDQDKIKEFIQNGMEGYNSQLNAELNLMTVLAGRPEKDFALELGNNVSVDQTRVVDGINRIQDGVDDVEISAVLKKEALLADFDAIAAKVNEIEAGGIYGGEAMIGAAAELSVYFKDTDAVEIMLDTLADYAMGMEKGVSEPDISKMRTYAANLGKVMSGDFSAMSSSGLKFSEAQKAIIQGEAGKEQIVSVLGEEYLDVSSDVQRAAVITQVVDNSWAGLYEIMSSTPEGQMMQMTGAWDDAKGDAGEQLYPYILSLTNVITENWEPIQLIIDNITLGLQVMMGVLSWIMEKALMFGQLIVDNWSWIGPMIYGIAAALAVYYGWQLLCAAANVIAGASALLPFLGIAALIIVIMAVCQWIAKLTGVADSGFGMITGGINVVIKFFDNLRLAALNVLSGIGAAAEAMGINLIIGIRNAKSSAQLIFYGFLTGVLTMIAKICEALNKIPFIEFDYSFVTSAADDYAAKAAEAIENQEKFVSIGEAFERGAQRYDVFEEGWASKAYEEGAEWGDGVVDAIQNFDASSIFKTTELPSAEDYADKLIDGGIGAGVENIDENTGAMAESMEITGEELKYLRDIAEQEAINRFTTAEINIEQTNHNTIRNGMDLDGVVSGLEYALGEAVEIMTEGVHE